MESKRLDFLDIAKGIAIILVLFSHSSGFPVFGNAVVAFYMPLFFFVSGYVYKPGRGIKNNIIRKLKQLLIPYAGFTLLLYAEHILLAILKHELTWDNIFMPLIGALYSRAALYADMRQDNIYFFTLSNGPMWFITGMAVSCVIFYCLVDKFLENRKNMLIITVVLIAVTVVFTYCPVLLPWSIDTAFACALFMLYGALLGKNKFFGDGNKVNIWYLILVTLVYCMISELCEPVNLSLRDYGYPNAIGAFWFIFAAMTGIIIFLWLCKYMEKSAIKNIFITIGKHTYTIMALHIIIIKYLNRAYYIFHMSFTFDRSCIWYWIYWICEYVAVIGICIVFDYVKDKIERKLGHGTDFGNSTKL